jgi:hypothetical protein
MALLFGPAILGDALLLAAWRTEARTVQQA